MRLSVTIPGLVTKSGDNAHVDWRVKARKVAKERRLVRLVLGAPRPWVGQIVITLVRVSPRPLDSAGLASALKGVEDEVAAWLGVDDGQAERSRRVLWVKVWERGAPRENAVRIVVEPLAPGLEEAAAAHPVLGLLLRAHGWAA